MARINLNRRAYETQRQAKHQKQRPVPEWLAEMLERNQNAPGKPAFDQEAYERERLAKHGRTTR